MKELFNSIMLKLIIPLEFDPLIFAGELNFYFLRLIFLIIAYHFCISFLHCLSVTGKRFQPFHLSFNHILSGLFLCTYPLFYLLRFPYHLQNHPMASNCNVLKILLT